MDCTGLVFVESGTKVDVNMLFSFQNDSVPVHHARDTVELLRREMSDFIAPDLWPPNSPDPNPDYRIWGVLQEQVYQPRVRDVDELRRRLIDCWSDMQQTTIDDAIDEWRARLRACVWPRGGHFEHLL